MTAPELTEDIDRLRDLALRTHSEATADHVTKVAAFGVAAQMVKDTLGCDLRVACMLLDCWLTEKNARDGKP